MKTSEPQYAWFWKGLDQYLADKKLKQTKQRNVIVSHFLNANDHVDAEGLHSMLKSSGFNIGLATVYRTLSLLKEAGLVEQRTFADGKAVYEVHNPDEHHDHLVCLDCGEVFEFENKQIEKLQTEVAKDAGFKLASHTLDLFGHCQKVKCSNRKNKT